MSRPNDGWRSAASTFQSLFDAIPRLISDQVTLLSLEMRRALRAVAIIAGLVIGAAVAFATAWTALWLGVASALIEAGVAGATVAIAVVLFNLALAGVLIFWARAQAHFIGLPATVRCLKSISHSGADIGTGSVDPTPQPAESERRPR